MYSLGWGVALGDGLGWGVGEAAGPRVGVAPGLGRRGVEMGEGRGWLTSEDSPGREGGRMRSHRARTLATRRAKTEARKTVAEGAALTGSRQPAQRACPELDEGSSPWSRQ